MVRNDGYFCSLESAGSPNSFKTKLVARRITEQLSDSRNVVLMQN